MKRLLALILLAALLVGCCPCPTVAPTTTPAPKATATATPAPRVLLWDARLDALHVRVEYVPDARYQLAAAWLTTDGSWDNTPREFWAWINDATGGGGDHHMFAGVYQLDGTPLVGKTVVFYKGNLQPDALITDAHGWTNGVCQNVYSPELGETGAYALQPLNGDKLIGGGLPNGRHVSVFGVWREVPAQMPWWQKILGALTL